MILCYKNTVLSGFNGRVTYLSPQSQDEMIEVIGKQFIQAKIVQEILEAKFYSILADEQDIMKRSSRLYFGS